MKRRSKKLLRLHAAAKAVGVSAITLRRWLLSGKVEEVTRDRNGWRLFTRKDVERVRRFATQTRPPRK
jgi:DNA (cytosine-5)-methyltransferase 1